MRDSEPPPDNGEVGKFVVGEDVLAYDAAGKCSKLTRNLLCL